MEIGGSSRTPSRPFSMTKWAFRDLNEMATSRGCVLSGALGAGALGRRHFRRFFWVLVFFLRCRCRKISITATPPGFPAASGFHSPYGPCYNCRCLLLRRGVCACAAPPAWAALWTVRVAALFCLPLLCCSCDSPSPFVRALSSSVRVLRPVMCKPQPWCPYPWFPRGGGVHRAAASWRWPSSCAGRRARAMARTL